ncbi:MAG: hypothetical protein GYB67_15585 [Chloroflexi bacterium]|nr:hypothetical protein [Chloroflexota bacterium]
MSVKPEMNGANPETSLTSVHDSMLDGLGQLATYFGFSKVMGQLYGAILLSPKPLCLDDLVERLAISKANASMNMRTLENMGMVRQVWVRGGIGRRKYYEAESDFMQIITNILKGREMRDVERALAVMETNINQLNAAMPDMDDESREVAEFYAERIEQMQALFRFAQLVISTILVQMSNLNVEDVSRIELGS